MMMKVLLLQLPIPQLNFGKQTGNVPLAAAWLKQATADVPGVQVEIVPESLASYLGDAALIAFLLARRPDIVGLTVYSWNARRSLFFARRLKAAGPVRIVFGGPEITPDNDGIRSPHVDFHVYGDGEVIFRRLLQDASIWRRKEASENAAAIFKSSSSPYLNNFLEPALENMMLLETQRGCPYHCGYCYYNKSRRRLAVADEEKVLEGVQWALDNNIPEVYLLDPSLNSRPDLKKLLQKIGALNREKALALASEIRADAVDAELADLLAAAGFSWFEIGLQSSNPEALRVMNRPTNLLRFVQGAALLKERGMLPRIDLIAGLPGDDLAHFGQSVDLVAANGLQNDVQVFPLSILPGTDFRRRHRDLELAFETSPPYTVLSTPTFSGEDLLLAFDYAEVRLDTALFPMPWLDVSWRSTGWAGEGRTNDGRVLIGGQEYVGKVILESERPLAELQAIAGRLTQPYQIFIGAGMRNRNYLHQVLEVLTAANPFSPLELVFLEPQIVPDTDALLSAAKIRRPHYLDGDLRYLFPDPGNRAVLFTLVSSRIETGSFCGEMQRQVYWWRHSRLPDMADLEALADCDGILIDPAVSGSRLRDWQHRFAQHVDDIPFVSFTEVEMQTRWLLKTAAEAFATAALNWRRG